MTQALEVLVLSEDGANRATETVCKILDKLLLRRSPDGRELRYIPTVERIVREACVANKWKSSEMRDYRAKTALIRTIATRLTNGVVVFHYDGDSTWSNRTASVTGKQFEREVRTRVAQLLSGLDDVSRRDALGRLVEAVPFYSVEAWTYQATALAVQICENQYQGRDSRFFREWETDRAALDDVAKIKNVTCLRSNHNHELAQAIPTREVLALGSSLAGLNETLSTLENLRPFLRFAAD